VKTNKTKKKNLLIIGGTGFIGYHCLNFAKKYYWKLTSVSRNNPHKTRKISGVTYLKLDINNQKQLNKKLKNNFSHVINLVGSSDQVFSKKKINNIHYQTAKKVMNYFSEKKVIKFIQVGSAAEYGSKKTPHKENINCAPKSLYGYSKLRATKHLLSLVKKKNFNATVVRLFQVYGENQNNDKIIPYILKKCLLDKKFKLTEGLQTRDFCHINDVVRGIFLLLGKKNTKGEIYNIASGKDISIKKLTQTIVRIVGFGKPLFGAIRVRKNEIFKSKADIKKIVKIGWKPRINLETGIKMLLKKNEK